MVHERLKRIALGFENLLDEVDRTSRTLSAVILVKSGKPVDEWWVPYLAQISALQRAPMQNSRLVEIFRENRLNSLKNPLVIYFGSKGYLKVLEVWEKQQEKKSERNVSSPVWRDNLFS